VTQVIERYGIAREDTIKPAEDTTIREEEPDILIFETIKVLEILKLFEIRQENGSEVLLRAFDQTDQRYLAKKYEGRKQRIIKSFFQMK
jgi:hypothetical protein